MTVLIQKILMWFLENICKNAKRNSLLALESQLGKHFISIRPKTFLLAKKDIISETRSLAILFSYI